MVRTAPRHYQIPSILLQVRLTEVLAPLKSKVTPVPSQQKALHNRNAKWANFGPALVDLGPVPQGAGDRRPIVHGMDIAQLFERSWFRVFDPALPELSPPFPQCFTREAIATGPMRCSERTCPGFNPSSSIELFRGGCVTTDRVDATTPPPQWKYDPNSKKKWPRCMAPGCELFGVRGQGGAALWARAWAGVPPPLPMPAEDWAAAARGTKQRRRGQGRPSGT